MEGAHLYGVEIDEHITKLFQQEETGSHTLSTWDCIYQIKKDANCYKKLIPCLDMQQTQTVIIKFPNVILEIMRKKVQQ